MIVTITFYRAAQNKESEARVAQLFGEFDKAARLYAFAAKKYWRSEDYGGVMRSAMLACENLHLAGQDEDAVEGMITISKMLLAAKRPTEALCLAHYYQMLESRTSEGFKGGTQFHAYMKHLCEEKYSNM